MTDTKWADVSEFQVDVDDRYPYRGIAIRSNDGTYRDGKHAHGLAWCKQACDTGRLDFFIDYLVYEPNWLDTFNTFAQNVGRPHPKMAVMIDMESWSGRLSGDQTRYANALRKELAGWLGSYMSPAARLLGKHDKRVIGYGNSGDLLALWPGRPSSMRVVLANYSSNPSFPGKLAHQYSDREDTAPFGPCDINSADGLTPLQVAKALGLDTTPSVKPLPHPPVTPPPSVQEDPVTYIATVDQAECQKSGVVWPGMFLTDGMALTHIATAADLTNFRNAGVKDLPGPISLAQYRALGGK